MLNPVDTFFSELTDPRTGQNIRYRLEEILLGALVTLLAGGQGYDDMADTTRSKLDFLRMYYPFHYGAPSEDTFRYVLMALDPRSFGDCFARWMGFLHEHVEGLIAIDGKCCRGSARGKGQSPLNIVNAYCHERGVVLAALDTPDKSNEITVLPELLRLLEIKGCVVTLDAMGCQKKVAAQIVDQKGDYLISLKGNQGNLHRDVADFFDALEATDANFREPDFVADLFEYEEKSHGRHYRRRVVVTADFCGGLKPSQKHWKGLQTVVRLESWRTVEGKTSYEKRYAISSLPPQARPIAEAMRGHWSVENQDHWMLDVYFGEDASRIRQGHAAKNLATLRRLCLNLARTAQKSLVKKRSVRRILRGCAMDDEFLQDILERGLKLYATNPNPA